MIKLPPVSNHDLLVERAAGGPDALRESAADQAGTSESPSFREVLTQLTEETPRAADEPPKASVTPDPETPPPSDPVVLEEPHGPPAREGEQAAQELPVVATDSPRKSDAGEDSRRHSASEHEAEAKTGSKADRGEVRDDASATVPRLQPRERAAAIETAPPGSTPDAAPAPPRAQPRGESPPVIVPSPDAPSGSGGSQDAAVRAAGQTVPPVRAPLIRRGESADGSTSEPRTRGIEEGARDDRSPTARSVRPSDIEVKSGPAPSAPAPPATAPAPSAVSTAGSAPSTAATTFLELQPTAAPRASGAGAAPSLSPSTAPAHPALQSAGEGFSPQIVRGALALTRTTGGSLTMRLEPESLGSLRIQMNLSQGRVAVQFHAETAQARGLLNQHMETLRSAMETQGLKLETVQIHSLSRPSAGGGQETGHQQHQSASGEQGSRQDAAGQQSRGHADTAERESQYRQAARHHAQQRHEGGTWREQWSAASAAATTTHRPGDRASR